MKQNLNPVKTQNFMVTQSNRLVEANYSSNLTTLAHKVAKLILSFVHPDTNENTLNITIEITKLKQYLGWSSGTRWNRFYNDLKDISKKLNKEPIEIILDDDKVLVAYFLSSYIIDAKKGEITFDISPKLIPHLVQLKKNFTSYQLKYIPALSSSYAIRMYELFYQYLKIGKRKFALEDFTKKVGAPSKYKYNDLKKRVLIPAQKQLKEHTNISFIFNEQKAGRRVIGLEFIIYSNTPTKSKEQIELDFLIDTIREEDKEKAALSETIIKAMEGLGINEKNIVKYLTLGFNVIDSDEKKRAEVQKRCKTLENYYLEKLELTKQSANKENAAGFFIKALKGDWVNTKAVKTAKAQEKALNRKKAEKQFKVLSSQLDALTDEKETAKSPIIEKLIADDTILEAAYQKVRAEMGSFMEKHYADILNLPIREQYDKGVGISSGVVMYLMENYSDKFAPIEKINTKITDVQRKIKAIQKQFPMIK